MKNQTPLVALAFLLAACGTPFSKRDVADSLRFRVRPPVAFEMLHDDETLPIVDLRSAAEFAGSSGHLARALNLPLSDLEERLSELSDLKHRTFLIYCGDDADCGSAALQILHRNGYRAVLMDGGIEEWRSRGFGTVEHRTGCLEEIDDDSDTRIAGGVQ